MKNKFTLALSIFVTILMISVGIGVITKVSANNKAQVSTIITAEPTALSKRELAYREIISQANKRIEKANEQISTMANQISLQSNVEPTLEPTSNFLFSAEQAAALAQQISGVQPKNLPELVSFSGAPAYEVVFGNGKVYIDANSGAFLFNGLQKQVTNISSEKALYIAAHYLKTSQPISINLSSYNGVKVYVVLFADGQSVYIDLTGKILAVQMAASAQNGNNSQSSTSSESQQSSGSSEENDD